MNAMNKKVKILVIVLFILLPLNASSIVVNTIFDQKESPNIIVGPYTQNQKINSIQVIWETDIATSNNEVHWGLSKDLGNISSEKFDFFPQKQNLHCIKLNELSHSKKYYYKVVSDDIESEIYSFYTSFERNKSVIFIVYGDSRGVWDSWKNTSLISQVIEEEKPHFVLHTGDIVNNGKNKSQWLDFFSISSFAHNSTLYPVLGNHEYYGSSYFKYFSLNNNERWYSFDNGPVHFVGLDSNPRNSLRLIQLFWLIKDLKINRQPFNIVFFHHPLYSSGNHGSTLYLRCLWGPIFNYFNIDIVFNGHDHNYERGIVRNISYIVTGGGGAPLYNVGESWWTIQAEKSYHYCLVMVNQSKLTFKSLKSDGNVIDYFNITK